jgi:hypothetical protein
MLVMQHTGSKIDEAARATWVDRILAAAIPADVLLDALEELASRQDTVTQAALFDSVLWRVDVRHYWVFFRMARVYAELGREESSFQMAALAVQMHPEWEASEAPFRTISRHFATLGDARAALDVFERRVRLFPERPLPHRPEVEEPQPAPPLDPPQVDLAAVPAASHRVVEAEQRAATPVRVVAGPLPNGLARLSEVLARDPIDVVELQDGELLVCNDAVAVRDSAGAIRADLSVGADPDSVARRVLDPAGGEPVERHGTEEAVLILDASAPANVCHFLFDQVSRLELYRRAGADLAQALVVGPELRTRLQRAIAVRAGMTRTLGTGRLARVRAKRLWVSTDCVSLQHPAHFGAGWVIEHARAVLGGRGASGTRRLYLSRADAQARQVDNEAELVAALSGFGFESIAPGTMTFEDQLAAFRAPSQVVAAHGTALATIVLCPPGARVLELFHPLGGSWDYAMVATACGLDYAALCGRDGLSDAPELNDPGRADGGAGRFGKRHLRVDPAAVRHWLGAGP